MDSLMMFLQNNIPEGGTVQGARMHAYVCMTQLGSLDNQWVSNGLLVKFRWNELKSYIVLANRYMLL